MGTKRNVDMSANTDTIKIVKAVPAEGETSPAEATAEESQATTKKATKARVRSKKYQAKRAEVDKTRTYDPFAAVEMIKRLSYSSFDGTITLDGLVRDTGELATITFPHSTGQTRKVVIVDDEVLKQIEAGNIDFDILISEPAYMPKLAKYAAVLGPKGLMPNPKTGTLTPNPENKKKELAAGAISLKTQKKMPVFHVSIGKVSMDTKQLVENINTLVEKLDKKLIKLSVSATMSPAVRIDIAGILK